MVGCPKLGLFSCRPEVHVEAGEIHYISGNWARSGLYKKSIKTLVETKLLPIGTPGLSLGYRY